MVGSHAERQPHIHSINEGNNLTCADMIVWPARLSCSPDLFCSAALIASSFCLVTNTRIGWWSWVLIMRLTWHFYLSGQVRSWRSEQFMNVILPTLTDCSWFPYSKGISTPARSWIWRSVTVRLCHNMMIKVLEAGYTDRDCTLEYVASDTRGSSL